MQPFRISSPERRFDLLLIRIIQKATTNQCADVIINEVSFWTGKKEAILEDNQNSIITEGDIYIKK